MAELQRISESPGWDGVDALLRNLVDTLLRNLVDCFAIAAMRIFMVAVANAPGRMLLMVTLCIGVCRDSAATKPVRPARAIGQTGNGCFHRLYPIIMGKIAEVAG